MKSMKRLIAVTAALFMAIASVAAPAGSMKVLASGQCPYFDFSEQAVTIEPGGSHRSYLEANADYTYFITGNTSSKTYMECSYKSGAQYVVYHIGADETAKNITFWFYGCDENVGGMAHDMFDSVNVTVKGNAAAPKAQAAPAASTSVSAALAGGKTGSLGLVNDKKVAMLYNQDKVPMASFSISDGTGNMPEMTLGQASSKDGKCYFTVSTKKGSAVKLSDSDKAVFTAQGYAGVCLNGAYINWP